MKNKIDLTRCLNCNKRPKSKLENRNFERYNPFCSYHCQEVYSLKEATLYLRR